MVIPPLLVIPCHEYVSVRPYEWINDHSPQRDHFKHQDSGDYHNSATNRQVYANIKVCVFVIIDIYIYIYICAIYTYIIIHIIINKYIYIYIY